METGEIRVNRGETKLWPTVFSAKGAYLQAGLAARRGLVGKQKGSNRHGEHESVLDDGDGGHGQIEDRA